MKKDMDKDAKNDPEVDPSLVAMFLKLSPEERIEANDDAVQMILELRNACFKRKTDRRGTK